MIIIEGPANTAQSPIAIRSGSDMTPSASIEHARSPESPSFWAENYTESPWWPMIEIPSSPLVPRSGTALFVCCWILPELIGIGAISPVAVSVAKRPGKGL